MINLIKKKYLVIFAFFYYLSQDSIFVFMFILIIYENKPNDH